MGGSPEPRCWHRSRIACACVLLSVPAESWNLARTRRLRRRRSEREETDEMRFRGGKRQLVRATSEATQTRCRRHRGGFIQQAARLRLLSPSFYLLIRQKTLQQDDKPQKNTPPASSATKMSRAQFRSARKRAFLLLRHEPKPSFLRTEQRIFRLRRATHPE